MVKSLLLITLFAIPSFSFGMQPADIEAQKAGWEAEADKERAEVSAINDRATERAEADKVEQEKEDRREGDRQDQERDMRDNDSDNSHDNDHNKGNSDDGCSIQ